MKEELIIDVNQERSRYSGTPHWSSDTRVGVSKQNDHYKTIIINFERRNNELWKKKDMDTEDMTVEIICTTRQQERWCTSLLALVLSMIPLPTNNDFTLITLMIFYGTFSLILLIHYYILIYLINWINSLAPHPSGSLVATGQIGVDPKICLWDTNSMSTIAIIHKCHSRGYYSIF